MIETQRAMIETQRARIEELRKELLSERRRSARRALIEGIADAERRIRLARGEKVTTDILGRRVAPHVFTIGEVA